MSKRRLVLANRRQRSILSDMLPFEVPPTFSNRGFYRFLRDNDVKMSSTDLEWKSETKDLDTVMRVILGCDPKTTPIVTQRTAWGATVEIRSLRMATRNLRTDPFEFRVAHKLEGRVLSIVHPRNQIRVAGFYADYSSLITYYASQSEFSIRRPVSVSRFMYFTDKLHQDRLLRVRDDVELDDREYEKLGSFFVYRKYSNIHKFFESYQYHQSEKKFTAMVQLDISRCFDSIYTHSISWAILGKEQTKFYLWDRKKVNRFADGFDRLMMQLNSMETNGIVIGPEFARIFAELILQAVDNEVRRSLFRDGLVHRRDYEAFRYVDDYFVFYHDNNVRTKVIDTLQRTLKQYKLSINPAKIRDYQKPIITELTIAKERISTLLNHAINPTCETRSTGIPGQPANRRLVCDVDSNRLIVRYKAMIKDTGVDYEALLNYTFAIVENKVETLLGLYVKATETECNRQTLTNAITEIMEFMFFSYSASPKVNHTVRICRVMSLVIEFVNRKKFTGEVKHQLFKYLHDNIVQQIRRNVAAPFREVETLYLLITLSQIGRRYRLPESVLRKYFDIRKEEGQYIRDQYLSHFSITVLLSYMRDLKRYKGLREFVELHLIAKMRATRARCKYDAESLILFLDLVVCPYVSDKTKRAIAELFGLDAQGLAEVQASNDQWFTAWGENLRVGLALDAKKSRTVY